MTREEIKLIRAHLVTTIAEQGPTVKVPVKAESLLAMVDLILAAPRSSKGR